MAAAVALEMFPATEDVAAVLCRAARAIEVAEFGTRESKRIMVSSRASHRQSQALGWPRYFVIHGQVEGLPVRASWFRSGLYASPALWQRARLLISLGEQFSVDLEDALAAMLTMVRASDRVCVASFGPLVQGLGILRLRAS